MRVESVNPEQLMAALVASKISYLELAKLDKIGLDKDLVGKTDGCRWLEENRWRLNDANEILRLINFSEYKELILKMMRRSDWMKLIELMDKEDLLRGLRFFSREKLLRLIYWLPKQFQIKILLRMLGLKYLVKLMRAPDILRMLRSQQIPMALLAKRLVHFMDPKYLKHIMREIAPNSDVDNLTPNEMGSMLARLKKRQVLEGMKNLPYKALHPFMMEVLKGDMQLLMHIPDTFIDKAFANRAMSELLLGAEVLPKGIIVELLEQLPDDYLMAVPALADDGELMAMIVEEYSHLILSLGASLLAT